MREARDRTWEMGEGAIPGSRLPGIRLGVDRVLRDPGAFPALFRPGGRVGLVTSDGAPPGSGTTRGRSSPPSTRLALQTAGVPLARLFAPEHGLSAAAADGEGIGDGLDAQTGLTVVSLYGARFSPDPTALADLDLVLFDLQDVGARFYTFLWTLSHLMERCSEVGIPLWVLDRPNPLGGEEESVEGPLPDPLAPDSLLCRWPIPVRHSLTLGEMARLLRAERGLDLDLEVVAMEGWRREHHWPGTGLPFHPPSPGIPAYESALLYPGLALLEATNVGEGRGTPLAFRWLGAAWMDPGRLADALLEEAPPGILARPLCLRLPGTRDPVPGVALEVTEPRLVRPVALGLRLLALLGTLFPSDFAWGPYPTTANPAGEGHLARLLGRAPLVEALEGDPGSVDGPLIRSWTEAPGWWRRAGPHLLYE